MTLPASRRFLQMKRYRKILVAAALLLVVLVIAAVVLVPRLIDVERYRPRIEKMASERVGRPVTLGEIRMRILPSPRVRIDDLRVAGGPRDGGEPLAEVAIAEVGVALLPLVSGELRLQGVRLYEPKIRLTREEDGRWSVEDLLERAETSRGEEDGRRVELDEIQVRNGELLLLDASRGPRAKPSALQVRELDADLRDLTRGPPFGLAFEGKLDTGGRIKWKGKVHPREEGLPGAVGSLVIDSLVLQPLAPWLEGTDAAGARGTLSADLDLVAQSRDEVSLDGRIQGTGLVLPGRLDEPSNLSLQLEGSLHPDFTSGRLEKVELELDDLTLSGAVQWQETSAGTKANLSLRSSGLTAPQLAQLVERRGIRLDLGRFGTGPMKVETELEAQLPSDGKAPTYIRGRGGVQDLEVRGEKGATLKTNLRSEFALAVSSDGRSVDASRVVLEVRESRLIARGSSRKTNAGTTFRAELLEDASLATGDLDTLLNLAGVTTPFSLTSPRPLKLTGSVLRTPTGTTRIDGSLEGRELGLRVDRIREPLQVASARITFEHDRADVAIQGGKIGNSDFEGTFKVRGFEKPDVGFALTSKNAELSELLSFLEDDRETGNGTGKNAPKGEDVVEKLTGKGTLKIAHGTFETLEFRDLETTVVLDGYEIGFDPFSLGLYEGTARLAARFDLAADAPQYSLRGRLDDVDVNALLSANTEFRDGLFGTASGRYDLRGRGAGLETVVRALEGSGNLEVKDGRVAKLDMFEKLAEISDLFGEQSLRKLSRKLAREGTEFEELAGNYTVSGGTLSTRDLTLVTPEATITTTGTVTLMHSVLDMSGDVVFSEEMSQAMRDEESVAAKVLWDSRKNRVVLPIVMTGPLESPSVKPQGGGILERYARKEAEREIEKKIGDVLGGVLGGPKKETAPAGGTTTGGADSGGSGSTPSAAPGVEVSSHRLSGNFLKPDLRFEGVFRGRDLAGADLEIQDDRGNRIYQEKDAFPEIAAWYASHSRTDSASISFRKKVDGSRLGGSRSWKVVVTLRDAKGGTASDSFQEGRGLKQLLP